MITLLKNWYDAEREKLRPLSRRAKAEYIWQYYKLWIIAIVSVVGLSVYITVHRLTVPADNWLYVTFANTYADVGNGSTLWRDFVDASGYDTREKNVYFQNSCYFDPSDTRYNAYYTYFVAYVEAGTLDAITMERDDLALLGTRGRLLDLNRPEADGLAEKYADRLIYAIPANEEYGPDPVPIGIDLSDTCLVTEFRVYEKTCALGISANCPHIDAAERFLEYIFARSGIDGETAAHNGTDNGAENMEAHSETDAGAVSESVANGTVSENGANGAVSENGADGGEAET